MRVASFVREAVPFVLAGVFLANLLYVLRIVELIGQIAAPVIIGVLGLPHDAAGGLVMGFLRKDVAVGMLMPLHLSFRQTVVASVVLAVYFPCVATFAVMLRELGVVRMLKASAIMVATALVTGGLLNLVLWATLG
jgi:ferrous iron transport protein B